MVAMVVIFYILHWPTIGQKWKTLSAHWSGRGGGGGEMGKKREGVWQRVALCLMINEFHFILVWRRPIAFYSQWANVGA